MDQSTARKRAKELQGIAIEARRDSSTRWRIGGWPNRKGSTWIVVSLDKRTVLDDGEP